MKGTHQIEPTSTGRLLACLGLAIDEAKLVRSIVMCREQANLLSRNRSEPLRLAYLNREIEYLEARLSGIRSKASSEPVTQ